MKKNETTATEAINIDEFAQMVNKVKTRRTELKAELDKMDAILKSLTGGAQRGRKVGSKIIDGKTVLPMPAQAAA